MPSITPFPQVPRGHTLLNIPRFFKNPIPVLTEMHKKYGDTFYLYVGGVHKSLLTRDPELIKEVLQKQHRNFEKSDLQTKMVGQYLGTGLLTNYGKDWLRQRRLIQPGFHKEKIENLMGLMMKVIEKYGEKLGQIKENEAIDIFPIMQELSFEIIARTLMSKPIPEQELHSMSKVVMEVQEFVVKQVRLPFLNPLFKLGGLVEKNKTKVESVRQQLMEHVNERRSNPGETNDLLDMLLAARYEDNGEPMSDRQLMDEMLILFVAGHETSANALSWVWYILNDRPEIAAAIREEVINAGDPGVDNFFQKPLTMEGLKKLALTNRVVQETMRMYPPAWITDRVALTDTSLDGCPISKNEMVIPFLYGLHHHPDFWEKPEEFNPDRFLPENIKSRKAYTYLPFGGGPRFCIGNNFALMEMQLTVAYLCYHFDFRMANNKPIGTKPLVTLRMDRAAMMYWKRKV